MCNFNIIILLLIIVNLKDAELYSEHEMCPKNMENKKCIIMGTYERIETLKFDFTFQCDVKIGPDYTSNKKYSNIPKIIWIGCRALLNHPGLEYIHDRKSVLNLIIARFTDITLTRNHLLPLTSLTNLTLMNNNNLCFELNTFDTLNKIKYLEFNNNTVLNNTMLKINLSNLKNFIINEPNLNIDNIIQDANLNNLENITINSGKQVDAVKLLKILPPIIQIVSLNKLLITNQSDLNFQSFQYLTVLHITCTNLNLLHFYKNILNNLTFLNLTANNLSVINFTESEFNRLEMLDLSKNMLTQLNENLFLKMPMLKFLNLSQNCIETLDQNAFIANKKLFELNLQDNKLKQLQLQSYVNNVNDLAIKVDRNNFSCKWLEESLKINVKLFEKFKFTPEIDAMNIKGLKCTYPSGAIEQLVNNTLLEDNNTVPELNYLIIIISILLIVFLTIIINVILIYYKRYRKSKRIPFYRLLNRDRSGQSTESTQSILFNRKLPATQYETPINSNYSVNSEDCDSGTINNNLYEEIPSNTTPIAKEAPAIQFSDTTC